MNIVKLPSYEEEVQDVLDGVKDANPKSVIIIYEMDDMYFMSHSAMKNIEVAGIMSLIMRHI